MAVFGEAPYACFVDSTWLNTLRPSLLHLEPYDACLVNRLPATQVVGSVTLAHVNHVIILTLMLS
jgi:hypothetical protein